MVFMSWSSKTWSQENDCQDLANHFSKSNTFLFKTWHAKFWNVTLFCKSMFPIIDTLMPWYSKFWTLFGVIKFISISKNISWLGFPRHEHKYTQVKLIVKTWQTIIYHKSITFLGSRLGIPKKWLCLSWLGLPRHEHKWKWLSRLDRPSSKI